MTTLNEDELPVESLPDEVYGRGIEKRHTGLQLVQALKSGEAVSGVRVVEYDGVEDERRVHVYEEGRSLVEAVKDETVAPSDHRECEWTHCHTVSSDKDSL